jgi:hypothetical protein
MAAFNALLFSLNSLFTPDELIAAEANLLGALHKFAPQDGKGNQWRVFSPGAGAGKKY